MNIGRASTLILSILGCGWVAIWCALAPSVAAQAALAANVGSSGVRAVINLDDGWRFQQGDDPRWADPAFDDKDWTSVALSKPLVQQGVVLYTGYGWYRLRLEPQQLAALNNSNNSTARSPLLLMITSDSVGQLAVYVNGVESGHTSGMAEKPSEYQSPSFVVQLTGDGSAPVMLAIRSWAGPATNIRRGLLERVEVGPSEDITEKLGMKTSRRWTQYVIAPMTLAFLFLGVAVLGAALYIAQRHHGEYLWLALLCLSVAAGEVAGAAFGLARISLAAYHVFIAFTGRIFMAATLEFILRFTGNASHKAVRGVQIAVLALPFLYLLPSGRVYDVLSVAAQVLFCAVVCMLLFRAWRRGLGEAGVMLLPFFLAATADSADTVLDYAASRHWLPERFASHSFHFGPVAFGTGAVAFLIFLSSLVAVILYRFIRVSQEEQKSTAEIAAARSVQALLIPTQLPSNKNFMLESAYLPVHGVGGDFFQVLPLKDDSLLIVVGDVSGKGLQAAMNSSTLVGALRNELSHDPGTVLSHLNRVLIGATSTPGAVPELDCAPCYATCLCARIFPDGTTTIANAGHLNPYRDGRELQLRPSLPLGVIADSEYEEMTFRLNRGDRLVFLSDGVVEAINAEGELFGFERTQQVSHEPARYIAQTAQRFGQTDDITVLSLYLASRAAEHDSHGVVYTS
jgi:phosphoserine phosphatase RsbU/P